VRRKETIVKPRRHSTDVAITTVHSWWKWHVVVKGPNRPMRCLTKQCTVIFSKLFEQWLDAVLTVRPTCQIPKGLFSKDLLFFSKKNKGNYIFSYKLQICIILPPRTITLTKIEHTTINFTSFAPFRQSDPLCATVNGSRVV
jgi:hypothetical protein